ncbi:SPFH domain / Band 7 family protein [Streptomyces sp. ADI98-10]|nr:SPFH domain / Band 7 family protein [Streptomyces sp. ADI98-10]
MTDVTERNREPVTPNDDQTSRTTPTPRTTCTPHSLDDQLPPSLFAPPGKGSPPPLFGPIADRPTRPAAELSPAPDGQLPPAPDGVLPSSTAVESASASAARSAPAPDAELPPSLFGRAGRESPPPLFGPINDEAAPLPEGEVPPAPDGELPPPPRAEPAPARDADKAPPGPSRSLTPEPPNVSLHLGPTPDRPVPASAADGRAPARSTPDGSTSDRRTDRPVPASAPDGPAPEGPAPDGPADRPAPARPVPLDGNLHLKPVRRLRTEPSAEWTPHPSYGAEPGAGKGPARKASASAPAEREPRSTPTRGPVDDPGPDTELDLVLDLAPGGRAASATFSVPVPVPASPTTVTTTATTTSYPGRRHSVIANETTASIPVHLLFRDDQEPAEPAEAAALPAAVVRRPAGGDRAPAARRPPVPRSPRTRVQPATRPAPVADPRLAERPGPALPGYAALLTGAAGIAGGLALLWWRGALPATWPSAVGLTPRADLGIGVGAWALLALLTAVVLLALGGLGRGRVGYAWVLTLFGDYRGSVRRTGLVWVSPLLLRRRVDVRLRHWRSEPLPAVDANGTALRVVVLVVWRIKDTVRAALGIEDHEAYLSAQVEAAMARVLSQLPADAFHEDAPSLRDAEAVGDALTRMLKADCEPVGVEVYSAQPTGIEYAPEVAAAMQRRRIAAIDSKHRDSVLTSVVDAVDDTVNRLTARGIVELDDYERKALVKDLTVAFYTGRRGGGDGA